MENALNERQNCSVRPIAAYPTAVGLGDDPHILGKSYYVYFTYLPIDATGWATGMVRRLTLSCY
jgi:hypothetical protein